MTKYSVTLEPNRSNPPRFAVVATYERRKGKVTRLLKRYNRGAVTGTKVIPFDRNKDWSRVQGERYTMVPDHLDLGLEARRYSAEDYANGVDLPKRPRADKDTKRVKVQQTAKRDWLIVMGCVRPGADRTEPKLEWVPGTMRYEVSYDPDTGEEIYRGVKSFNEVDLDTCDQAIAAGYYKVKE